MSERSVDYERYLRDFGDGSIWLLKEDAIRLGAGYLPVRDDKTITTKLRAPSDQAELNERTLLGAINDASLTIKRPEMLDCEEFRYVDAEGFLVWLEQYITQTKAEEIVFPNVLAGAIRSAKYKAKFAKSKATFTPEYQRLVYSLERLDKLNAELAEVESKATLTFSEFEKKEDKVKALRQEIARMEFLKQHERGDFPNESGELDAEKVLVPDFIAFPKAMNLLKDKWQATSEELAVWVFLGPEQGGLAAFTNANELNPTQKFFFYCYAGQGDYLSPLTACWFRQNDIEQFVPAERYIMGATLIERWRVLPGNRPEAFILAKIAESRLQDMHPTFGGTQGTFGDNLGGVPFPPLDSGLFSIGQIEKIEAEDGIVATDHGSAVSHISTENRTVRFVTLKSVVESTRKPYQDILCLARDNHERLQLLVLVNYHDLVRSVPQSGTTGKSGYFAIPWADINDLIQGDRIAVDRVIPINGRYSGVGEMDVGLQRRIRDGLGAIRLLGEPYNYEFPKDIGKFSFLKDQIEDFIPLAENQRIADQGEPVPVQGAGKQNSFVFKAGLCHITFEGIILPPIKAGQPLKDIAGRLAYPYQKWNASVFSMNQPALDAATKKTIKSSYFLLRDKISACKGIEEKENYEEDLEKLKNYIKENHGYITDDDRISWNKYSIDNSWQTFKKSIKRGIKNIQRISPSLATHLENYLKPGYCYQPPVTVDIHWFVEFELDEACQYDPLEIMAPEEKNILTRKFYGTGN